MALVFVARVESETSTSTNVRMYVSLRVFLVQNVAIALTPRQ